MTEPDPLSLAVPPTESPFLEQILAERELSEADRRLFRDFAEKGYVVFDTELSDFDAVAERMVRDLDSRYSESDRRVEQAWYFSEDVRRLATCPRVLEVLELLYQRRPIPFQTLNFEYGTQQAAHSDALHFHCVPRHFMCGVWIALEDIHPDSGPLFVYPGSHLLPDYDMHDFGLELGPENYPAYEALLTPLAHARGFERVELLPRKGQAIVWAASLLHGGSAVRDPARTRRSQATHYYFGDGLHYFPMSSDPYMRSLCMREVIDIGTGRFVTPSHRGERVQLDEYRMVSAYPRPLPDWVEEPPNGIADGLEESPERLRARVRTMRESLDAEREAIAKLRATRAFRLLHGVEKTLRRFFPVLLKEREPDRAEPETPGS